MKTNLKYQMFEIQYSYTGSIPLYISIKQKVSKKSVRKGQKKVKK